MTETRKQIDEALLMVSVLKRLGAGRLNSLDERIKCQKMQYFAQLFGVSPAYHFNLYVHGPYSPDLAWDLYHVERQKISTERFVADELEEKFQSLKSFVNNLDVRKLEILATFHWLKKVVGLTPKEAEDKLNELKGTTVREYNWALEKLKEVPT